MAPRDRYGRSQPSDAERPAHVRLRWTRLRDAIARCCFLVAFAIASLPEIACAGELEGAVGLGMGVTSIGGRRATGGLTLLPNGEIGWRFAQWGSLRYRNTLLVFNLTSIQWIGVMDMNTPLLGIHMGRVILETGPSLDLFAIPLCADTWCQREHGLALGGHIGATLFPDTANRFAAGATVHLTDLPGIAWSGPSVTAAVEGGYRW